MPRATGYFEGDRRRPYIDVRVLLPGLGVAGAVPFLVDTGADTTTIHWGDRHLLTTLDGSQLSPDVLIPELTQALGIASTPVEYGRQLAVLVFSTEEGSSWVAGARVNIELAPSSIEVPSLLGRDVLSEARMDFNMPADDLVLDWAVA